MDCVVLSCAFRNLNLIEMGANSFYNLVRSQPLACQGLIDPSHHLQVSFINQHPIVDAEVSPYFNMKGASFIVNTFKNVINVVVYCCHSLKPFFCTNREEFVVIIVAYSAWIKPTETSVRGEFMNSSSCGIMGKFCKRQAIERQRLILRF